MSRKSPKISRIQSPNPLPVVKIIEICKLCTIGIIIMYHCTNLCYFTFEGTFYLQRFGLPMGSPLSGVFARLFLEMLEAGPLHKIFPANTTYFRYIDDALIIYPRRTKLDVLKKTSSIRLKKLSTSLLSKKMIKQLPSLDIFFERTDIKLLSKCTGNPTNWSLTGTKSS